MTKKWPHTEYVWLLHELDLLAEEFNKRARSASNDAKHNQGLARSLTTQRANTYYFAALTVHEFVDKHSE